MGQEALQLDRPGRGSQGWAIGLWVGQVLLFLMFMMAGLMKVVTPADQLEAMMKPMGLSLGMARFIGVVEVAGALGVLLPALTRVLPLLTPLAAVGLFVVMVLATGFNAMHGATGSMAMTIVLAILALFVAWGRWKKAPIRPRGT